MEEGRRGRKRVWDAEQRLDWKGQPIRNLRAERGESEVRTPLVFHRDLPSLSLFFTFSSSPTLSSSIFQPNVPLYPRSIPQPSPLPLRRRATARPLFAFQGMRERTTSSIPAALVSYPAGSFGFLLVASPRRPVWILTVRINDPGDSNEISTPAEVCLINGIPGIVIANSDERKLRHVFNAFARPRDFPLLSSKLPHTALRSNLVTNVLLCKGYCRV